MPETSIKHYTDTLYYEVELTAKYCKVLGNQLLHKVYPEMTPDELTALDVIFCNPEICQRDLAKKILKDRANTGRIADTLEAKGLVLRLNDTKNKRLVKKLKITDKGIKVLDEGFEKLIPTYNFISQVIPDEEIMYIRERLKKLRDTLSQIVEMQI